MIIGIPKEIKDNENRVGMPPGGVHTLVEAGHQVLVQAGAGTGSGFTDEQYKQAGATIKKTAAGWVFVRGTFFKTLKGFDVATDAKGTIQSIRYNLKIKK